MDKRERWVKQVRFKEKSSKNYSKSFKINPLDIKKVSKWSNCFCANDKHQSTDGIWIGMSLNDFVPGEGLDDNVCPVEEAD